MKKLKKSLKSFSFWIKLNMVIAVLTLLAVILIDRYEITLPPLFWTVICAGWILPLVFAVFLEMLRILPQKGVFKNQIHETNPEAKP